jgi:hypothetical protein
MKHHMLSTDIAERMGYSRNGKKAELLEVRRR